MSALGESAQAWLDGRRGEMEALLETLVNIDSGSYDKAGVDRAGDAITAFLDAHSIAVERLPVEGFGDVLRATLPARSNGKPALLMGHRDTVFPKGTPLQRPYLRQGDIAFGPGVADMKSGLVLNCFVLLALAQAGPLPFPIVALFTGDEEIGSGTGRPFIETEARLARAVFNSEPGRVSGNVVTGRKGGLTMTIEVTGKASHAGANHADGASAIEALARKIIRLHALTDYATGITTNVGVISGGIGPNTVAPSASAVLDVRFVGLDQKDTLLAAIQAIVDADDGPGTTAVLVPASGFLPMEERWSQDLMARYQAAARRVGFEVSGEFTGGCSDAGFTASLGIPTLCGLGPVGAKAHTDEEYCRLDTLVPRAQAMVGAILSLAED